MEAFIFFVFAALALAGAFGVVLARNPVHSALSLVVDARQRGGALPAAGRPAARGGAGHRLRRRHRRAVPVRDHAARRRPRRHAARSARGQRPPPSSLGLVLVAEVLFLAGTRGPPAPRPRHAMLHGGARARQQRRARRRVLFTDFLWPFEITAALLVLAVIGAVVLARRSRQADEARAPRTQPVTATHARAARDHRDLLPHARRDALHHRRGRPAHAPQRAGDVHVRRAHAQRGEPHVRLVRQRAQRHPRPGDRVLRARRSRPPRSPSASRSSSPSSASPAAPPPTTSTCCKDRPNAGGPAS